MKPSKMKRLSEAKVRYGYPKNAKFHFYPNFWAIYDVINNFIARFMFEDEVSPT